MIRLFKNNRQKQAPEKKVAACLLTTCLIITASAVFSQEKYKTEANADLVEYTHKDGLPTTNISAFAQTRDGYIWLSGIEGTYRFNGYEFEEVGEDIGLPKMQNMYYDSVSDELYFASPQKLIRLKDHQFKVYTGDDGYMIKGLDGQVIRLLKADSKGRLWIGSFTPFVDKKFNGGLTKFENGQFTVYDSIQFPLDNATGFAETPYGDLIFRSQGHNTQTREGSYIALYKDGKFRRVDESMGIDLQGANLADDGLITSVDREGNFWIAFAGISSRGNIPVHSGVLIYDGNRFHHDEQLKSILGTNQVPLQVYYSKSLDKLFLATYNLEGETFNGKNQIIYEYVDGKWIVSDIMKEIYPIKNLKTGNVIDNFKFSGAFFTRPNKFFPELLIIPSTNDLQSSRYATQLFYYYNDHWVKYDAFEGSRFNELKDGALFTHSKGFGIYYPNHSKMLTARDGLLQSLGYILQLTTDANGLVWISYSYTELPPYAGVNAVGINLWDGKKLRTLTEEDGLASNITFQAMQDSKQRIWIPTDKGLTLVREIKNGEGEQILKLTNIPGPEDKPYNTARVRETSNGDIYAYQDYVRPETGNLTEAVFYLAKLEGDRIVKIASPFSEADNATKYQLFDLREDNDGRIWLIGTFAENLKDLTSVPTRIMIYDGNKWEKPPDSWNIPGEQLHYVGTLKNGMYFLTVGDFYLFNGERFISLGDSTNENADFRILKGASVTGTKTDIQAGGRLYIRLRNRGLVIFDGTHLDFYTKKEGLPTASLSNPVTDEYRGNVYFSSPSAALKIHGHTFQSFYSDENIVNGGPRNTIMDGFGNMLEFYNGVGLYIDKMVERTYQLEISNVSVEDQPHYMEFPKKLAYSQNSFVFNYAALNFREPKQTTYEHFLEGYDKDWSKPSSITFAEYQNLPFGKYNFKVRGITSNGVNTNVASYSFLISPPFWRTWWAYVIYGAIFLLGVFAVDRIQRRRLHTKEQRLIAEKELAHAKEIEKAYTELKSTQKQLIHAEKMASLGELMAGIAHEIQNPLNFVNNFSEVSNELIDEMNAGLDKGAIEEVKAISNDVKRNLDKITYHGKRADAIVKGMLQHSNKHNGQKELTDINLLTDEYLRLSYHGMKAKDKLFNTTISRDFDNTLPKIEVVPQDIGRVLLNLINNAFYAVNAKGRHLSETQNFASLTGNAKPPEYKSTVIVTTKNLGNHIEIRVQDNGDGIPDDTRDKIFQPFFTTKPTGEGTGLGLSLSYDIVKAHGGELRVEARENEGSEFIISIPI